MSTRVDWQIAASHLVTTRVSVGRVQADAPDFGLGPFASLGSQLKGTDVSGAAALTSKISAVLTQDLRLGFSESRRDYSSAPLPWRRSRRT